MPEDVKTSILLEYDELVNDTQRRWEELVLNEENKIKSSVEDKKHRIVVIEADEKYVGGEKYYKENETIKQMSVRSSEERKKVERLTKIHAKQTEINEQILQTKGKIFQKQRVFSLVPLIEKGRQRYNKTTKGN